MVLKQRISSSLIITSIIVLFSIPISNGLCNSNCSACALEYSPPFTVVYNASKARPDLRGQTFLMSSSDSSVISSSVSKYFIIQGGILRINNATNFSRNEIALNVFGNTILPVTYRFSILAFTNPPTNWIISVCVQGLDNNTPTFPKSEIQFSVIEGTVLSQPMDLAADNDEGENSTQNYSILSNDPSVNSDLYLDIARNSDKKITSILLTSIAPLRKGSYNFTMVAQEGRPNTTKGYQKVYVIVQYLCNSLPIFELPTYQISLPLRTPVNAIIINFKAVHVNSQTTAPIYYSITSGCSTGQASIRCTSSSGSANLGPFALDYRSGNLTLTSALDYYQAHQFNITLVATDACNLVGSALVFVQITLIPPSIQVIFSNNGMIREDYALTSYVATVIVNDPDGVNVSVIVLDNTTGIMSNTFYLVSLGSSYRLRLLHTLDSKVKSSYYITIQASDPANNIVYFTFNITIVGVNHPPVFENKIVFIKIPYNTANGMKVMRVHASDSDLGGNGIVTYELPPSNTTFPYQNNFTVVNVSGDILVNGTLNRNVPVTFLLLIKARDNPTNGDPSLMDYMVVNVTLVDAQLYFVYLNVPLVFQVQEVEPAGTIVGTISTSLSYTGHVFFTILHYNPDDVFAMDSSNGTITTKKALSAATGRYTLLIAATYYPSDQSTPPMIIQQMVNITVTQRNEKGPSSLSTFIIVVVALSVALAVISVLVAIFFASYALRQRRQGSLAITEPDSAQTQTKEVHCEQIKMTAEMNESIVAFPEQVHPFDSVYADSHQRNSLICQSLSPITDNNQSAIRSTSDLASTVTTEMLTGMEDKDPFISEQVAAIYAANAQLLQEGHSQNSVHMFGSEGGFEVDEVDFGPLYFDDDDNDDSGDSMQNHSQSAGPSATELKGPQEIPYPNGIVCINLLQHPVSHGSQPVLAQQQRWLHQHIDVSHASHGHHGHSYSYDAHDYHPHKAKYTSSSLTVDQLQPNIWTSTPLHNPNNAHHRGCVSFSHEQFVRHQIPNVGISNCLNGFQVPSHLTNSHNDIRTPPSASPTDDGIIAAQRDPERYISNLSLGSTHLS